MKNKRQEFIWIDLGACIYPTFRRSGETLGHRSRRERDQGDRKRNAPHDKRHNHQDRGENEDGVQIQSILSSVAILSTPAGEIFRASGECQTAPDTMRDATRYPHRLNQCHGVDL